LHGLDAGRLLTDVGASKLIASVKGAGDNLIGLILLPS